MVDSRLPYDRVECVQSCFGFGISQEGEFWGVEPSEMVSNSICSNLGNPSPFMERDANVTTLVVRTHPPVLGVLGLSALTKIFKAIVIFRTVDVVHPLGELAGNHEPYQPVFSAEAPKESYHSVPFSVDRSCSSPDYTAFAAALLPIEPILTVLKEKFSLSEYNVIGKIRSLHQILQDLGKAKYTNIFSGVQLA
jgi:hypothetical protein